MTHTTARSLYQILLSVAVGVLAAQSDSILAMSGGVSVDDVLRAGAGPRYTEQQIAFAAAVSAVTVPLFNTDASGKPGSLCSATIVHPRVVLTAAHCVLNGLEVSRRIIVLFDRAASRLQGLDAIVHPGFLKNARESQSLTHRRTEADISSISKDLALVLLHRPIPDSYAVVAPVPRGFRDSSTSIKVVAGYGTIGAHRSMEKLSLRFAEMRGNSRLDQGGFSGEGEIIMESKYLNGARVNVCSGDSGGPIFVLERGASRLRQLAVTSAADEDCREAGIFAPIDAQRAVLRNMFDTLMQGESGADRNPF